MQNFKTMTLKTHTLYKFTIISIFFIVNACSSFLEQEPGSQVSITEQLSNKEGILKALNGIYGALEANVRGERFAVYADSQGGNLKFTPNATGNNKGVITPPINLTNIYAFNDQALSSDFKIFYDGSYAIINQTNLVLEFIDNLPDATTSEKNQIKAEVFSIRAYCHFLLSLAYSQAYNYTPNASHLGVVYNTGTLTSGITYPARETVFNTYKFIIEDIKTALDLYTNTNALPVGPSYSYFNSYTTKALLARVYLYQNDWKNAFKMADDVIKNSNIILMSKEDYVSQWKQPDLPVSEILLEFSIPRDAQGGVGGSMAQSFGYSIVNNTVTYGKYVSSEDLLALYEPNDVRRQLFTPINLPTLVNEAFVNKPYYFTEKFQNNPGYVAFRLSELYLIRAEASLKLDKLDDAKNDINILRTRANATLLTDTNNLETAILQERRKELCFEGQFFFDLARNKKDIYRNDGCISSTCSLSYPSLKYILPIPLENTNLNTNLEQNESY